MTPRILMSLPKMPQDTHLHVAEADAVKKIVLNFPPGLFRRQPLDADRLRVSALHAIGDAGGDDRAGILLRLAPGLHLRRGRGRSALCTALKLDTNFDTVFDGAGPQCAINYTHDQCTV